MTEAQIATLVKDGDYPEAATRQRLPIRRCLDVDEDRALLILRVDRRMSWRDVAHVLAPAGDVARASQRLRKQFERVKDKLRRELVAR